MELPVRKITAQRGGILYVDPNNYVYHRDRKHLPNKTVITVKCQHRRLHMCGARGNIDTNTNMIKVRGIHTHAADFQKVCTNELRRAIITRAGHEGTPLQQIYDEECLKFPDAACWLPLSMIRSTVYRAKTASVPPTPPDLSGYGEILLDEAWRSRFGSTLGPNAEPLCQVILEGGESIAVILASRSMCAKLLADAPDLLIDGTFKVLPETPPISQMLTVHVMHFSQAIPVVFVLIKHRTGETLKQVLAFVKDTLAAPSMTPSSIVTDFDPMLQEAIRDTFPEAEVTGSWFHYCQAVLKKTRTLNMTELIQNNSEAKRAVRLLLVLPLLPAEKMHDGLQAVADLVLDAGVGDEMYQLMTHMAHYWLSDTGPMGCEVVSVCGQPKRAGNHIEVFHKNLRGLLNVHAPGIWLFTESIQKLENRVHKKFDLVMNSSSLPSTSSSQQDRRISAAYSRLMTSNMTALEFLTAVSPTADNTEAAILRNARPGGDSDSEDDDSEVCMEMAEAPIGDGDATEEITVVIEIDDEHFG